VTTQVSGSVPGTLSLTLAGSANLGALTAGLAHDYETTVAATVSSSGADATLSVSDPSPADAGRLVNGTYALAQPVQARATNAANPSTAFAPVGTSPLTLLTYAGPASNDTVTIGLKQTVGSTEPLRTGTYSKTLTFTLSTTTP
jgi:hypothetical protein